ncbi:MAG: hypothetical protein QW589_00235 [Candidatus Bathyarchaeia archaeon]
MKKIFLIMLLFNIIILTSSFYWKPSLSNSGEIYGGGLVYGQVLGFNMYDELIPLEWAKVIAIDENEEIIESASTLKGGYYEMFLPVGKFKLKVEHPGYISQSMDISISSGSSTSINFYLEPSGVPIPEFSYPMIQLLIVLTILAFLAIYSKFMKNFF